MTKILIVDDDPDVCALYKEILSEDYPSITVAQNGKVAVKLLAEHKIDLIITDMVMPEQDGLNTILEIRHQFPHVKIIAVSGDSAELNRAQFFGANIILNKPLDPSMLCSSIEKLDL